MRAVLRRPDFRMLFAGLVASMIGESVLLLALAVWVKDLTKSDGMAGATIFAIVTPIVFAPIVGWVVDRFRRQPFFVLVNVATAVALTPLLAVRDRGDVWLIYLVAALYGLSYIAISAALNGLIKQIVPSGLLAEANGALQTVKQGLRLGGPLIGAALYAAVGGWLLAVVAAIGFLVAAAAVALLRVQEESLDTVPAADGPAATGPAADGPAATGPARTAWLTEVAAGIHHLAAEPALRRLLLGVGLNMLVLGFSESLVFAVVDRGLHRPPAFVGVLVCVQGVGGLLGGLASTYAVRRLGEIGAAALGLALFVPAAFAMANPRLLFALPGVIALGAGIPLAVVGLNTLLQRRTPAALLGRATAASDALLSGPQAVSIGVGAILVSLLDYRLLFVGMGVVTAIAAGYLWRGRWLSPPEALQPQVGPDRPPRARDSSVDNAVTPVSG